LLKDLEGLKFPDDYVIKFFFKEKLDVSTGRVLEFGCSNGNNLMLFFQFGWEVIGVDKDKKLLEMGSRNFAKCRKEHNLSNQFDLICQDMIDFVKSHGGLVLDVLLLPNIICYLSYSQILEFFREIKKAGMLKKGSLIFIRTRDLKDYRFGKGERIDSNTYRLKIGETGENGCINTFLSPEELAGIVEKNFELEYKHLFECYFDNRQMDRLVGNADIIFWGKVQNTTKA